jgi:phenylalanine ammonia-lyase
MEDIDFSDFKKSFESANTTVLTGKQNLKLSDIIIFVNNNSRVILKPSKQVEMRLTKIHSEMLKQVESGIPIYGTTSSYGGQATRVLTKGDREKRIMLAKQLSNAIVHVDVSTGPVIPKNVTRAAMLIRLNMLLPGYSAVRLKTLSYLANLINKNITPIVGSYGGLGASGDLAQNGRVLSVLLQKKGVNVWNESDREVSSGSALKKLGLEPLDLDPKEGLALVNGDNFSSAAAALIVHELTYYMFLNNLVSSLVIQALKGSVRDYHPILSKLKPHPGQAFEANILRSLLLGSKLARQDLKGHVYEYNGASVQDPYSIRCLPQYYSECWQNLTRSWKSIEINANSVSDNPVWVTPEYATKGEKPYQWVSGGNFLAMHLSEVIDGLRKVAIKIVKQNDRHLARLIHPDQNKNLPANLSGEKSVAKCVFKGLQTQMGMYEVYASILASPVSTAFGIHEELNQDVTSHAFTSAILTWDVLRLVKYSIATNLISACQAIDLRGGVKMLSPSTKDIYIWLRDKVPYIVKEQPMGHYIENISMDLKGKQLNKLVVKLLSNVSK